VHIVGLCNTYLAGADFVESDESKSLCKHGAWEIFLRQQQGHGDQREQDLRNERKRFDTDTGVGRLLRAEMQQSVVYREIVAVIKAAQMISEGIFNERLSIPTCVQCLLMPSGER